MRKPKSKTRLELGKLIFLKIVICCLYSEREDHMNTNQNKFGWGSWLRWVLASILGAAVGVAIGGFAGSAMGEGFASMGTV